MYDAIYMVAQLNMVMTTDGPPPLPLDRRPPSNLTLV